MYIDLLEAYRIYEDMMSKRKNEDYCINDVQMQKMIDAYNFFTKVAKERHGHMEPFKIVPKEEHGYVTGHFPLFYLDADGIKEFTKILNYMSAISIDATLDGITCVSFTIPRVFVKRHDKQ